jgi:hypothetical protein
MKSRGGESSSSRNRAAFSNELKDGETLFTIDWWRGRLRVVKGFCRGSPASGRFAVCS